MKPRLVIVMLLVLALAVPASMPAQGSKAEQEVRTVMAELEQSNLKGGAEAASRLEKLLADDFIRIPPNGTALTKADVLDGWRTGKIKVASLVVSDIKVRIYGHTAIVTGIETSKAAMMGANYLGKTRLTRIFVKRASKWECVLFQSTTIAEPAKQAEVSATQTTNQLVGTYRLISYQRTIVATGETEDIFGKVPHGYITYGRDGRMMVLLNTTS
jgi:hypothetical protein